MQIVLHNKEKKYKYTIHMHPYVCTYVAMWVRYLPVHMQSL